MDRERHRQVFINCPFDTKYKPLFDATVFAIHDLGFQAVCALNKADGGALRLPRIYNQLSNCAYSIHDLSRVTLDAAVGLPRFNMPFEAGLAYAMHASPGRAQRHEMLILDATPHRYQASISDLAGLDPKYHLNDPTRVIAQIRTFFSQHLPRQELKPGKYIQRRYWAFQKQLSISARASRFSKRELTSWDNVVDLQHVMVKWIKANP